MCVSVYLTLGLLTWMFTDMAAESAKIERERQRRVYPTSPFACVCACVCVERALWVMLHFLNTSLLAQATGMPCCDSKKYLKLPFKSPELLNYSRQTILRYLRRLKDREIHVLINEWRAEIKHKWNPETASPSSLFRRKKVSLSCLDA